MVTLAVSSGNGTVGTPVPERGHSICFESGVSYPNHTTEREPFSQDDTSHVSPWGWGQ